MIVLSRRVSERLVIDPTKCPVNEQGLIEVFVTRIKGSYVRIGVKAPRAVPVHRGELYDAIQRERAEQHPAAEIVANEIEQGNVDLPGEAE